MPSLKWSQVRAYRLRRSQLHARAPKRDLERVVSDMCGVQAQLRNAAEIALWTRLEGIRQGDLDKFLFRDKSIFKTWSMRGTLHLLASSEFPMYSSGLRTRTGYRKGAWLRYFGVTLEEIEMLTRSIGRALSEAPLTRKELVMKVTGDVARIPKGISYNNLRMSVGSHRLFSSWGEFLKPAAYNGLLAFGPVTDGEATFVRADKWLGAEMDQDSSESMKEIVRKYLSSYGPAKPEDFARWWGTQPAAAKRLLNTIQEELLEVDVEGHNSWITKQGYEDLREVVPETVVRLLPNFDSYVLGFHPRSGFVLDERLNLVFRPQGWISPVLLVDGKIGGIWESPVRQGKGELRVRLFQKLTKNQEELLRDEVRLIGDYYGCRLTPILAQ